MIYAECLRGTRFSARMEGQQGLQEEIIIYVTFKRG